MEKNLGNYREYTSNHINALARIAVMGRISLKAFMDFPKNLPKELKQKLNEDLEFLKRRKEFRRQGFLTQEDFSHFTKDYDPLTRYSILLMFTNQFSIDAMNKIFKSKNPDQAYLEMQVKDAFRYEFLEKHNIPDRNLTVKDFNAKYGANNVLLINFYRDNAFDHFIDSVNYNYQLYSQMLAICLAQFESFLVNSIRLFIYNNSKYKIIKEKKKNKTRKYLVNSNSQENNPTKIRIPNLQRACFWSLVKFITNQQINLLPSIPKKTKDFLLKTWYIRNLIIHNGGYVNRKFANRYKEHTNKIGQLIDLNSDLVGNAFSFIWRSSLKIYSNLLNQL